MMLRLDDVWAGYGAAVALQGVSLEVPTGTVVALLGANGAGKSSTMAAIAGLLPLRRGAIDFDGRPLHRLAVEARVRAGVALVAEGRMVLRQLTVLENLRLGAYVRRDRAEARRDLDALLERFPVLGRRRAQPAGLLSGGEQQQLVIARALMSRPRLLLLDEPSLGLAPALVREVFATIGAIREDGVTVLVADQNAELALLVADRGYVLRTGRVALEGAAADLRADDGVRRSYLGA